MPAKPRFARRPPRFARLDFILQDDLERYWSELRNQLMLRSARPPDYRARDQTASFKQAGARFAAPNASGQDGGEVLRAYVCRVLLDTITSEQTAKAEFRAQPWYVRMHAYWASPSSLWSGLRFPWYSWFFAVCVDTRTLADHQREAGGADRLLGVGCVTCLGYRCPGIAQASTEGSRVMDTELQ